MIGEDSESCVDFLGGVKSAGSPSSGAPRLPLTLSYLSQVGSHTAPHHTTHHMHPPDIPHDTNHAARAPMPVLEVA